MTTCKKTIIQNITWWGVIVNSFLAVLKIVGGKLTGSAVLIADGVHSITDLLTDGMVLFASKCWNAPPDKEHPYGHGRFETLTSMFISVLLFLTAIGIVWDALRDINKSVISEDGLGVIVLVIAFIAILCKELLYHEMLKRANKINSRALAANALHHRSDALSSVLVVIAVIVHFIVPDLKYVDSIAAIIIAIMILKACFDIFWPAFLELSETQADEQIADMITLYAKNDPEIQEVHDIRSRRIGSAILLDLHLLVDPLMSVDKAHAISENFKSLILNDMDEVTDVIIHIEPFNRFESHQDIW